MDSHDEILRQHQTKMEMHRKWVEEQQRSIGSMSPTGSATKGNAAMRGASNKGNHHVYQQQDTYATAAAAAMTTTKEQVPSGTSPSPNYYAQSYNNNRQVNTGGTYIPYTDANNAMYAAAGGYPQQSQPAYASPVQESRPPFSVVRRTPQSAHRGVQRGSTSANVLDDEDHFVSVTTGSPISVYMRGSQWLKRKEHRLEEQRHHRIQEELADCPFVPQVGERGSVERSARRAHSFDENNQDNDETAGYGKSHSPEQHSAQRQSASRISNSDPADIAPGVLEHLQRQEKARLLLKEREERLGTVGQSWTPQTTVAEPFHLGRRVNPGSIRSLQQPMQAPHRSVLDPTVYHCGILGPDALGPFDGRRDGDSLPPPGAFSKNVQIASPSR